MFILPFNEMLMRNVGKTVILALICASGLNAQTSSSISISGYVFDDANNNGIRDVGEKGVKNVAISDQVSVSTTNDDGFFRLEYASSYGIVFISVPSGYQSSKPFWQRIDGAGASGQVNFPLRKIAASPSFTFIQASDTHADLWGRSWYGSALRTRRNEATGHT